jgi:hypothetical protein
MTSAGAPRRIGLAVMVATVAGAGAAGAQTPAAAAEALFDRGRELLEAGHIAQACRAFEASHRVDPALGTTLHLADCLEREGRTASAWARFRDADSLAQSSGQTQRQEIAATRWRALEPRLARVVLEVRAPHRPAGLSIEVAGVRVPPASWGVPLPVDPGPVTIRASAPGHFAWAEAVVARGASTATVTVPRLAPAPSPAVRPAAPRIGADVPSRDDDSGDTLRTVGVIAGGVGLATIAAGTVFGVQAIAKNDASLERCRPDDASLCSASGVVLRDEASSRAAVSTGLFVAGGVLLGAGVVLYVAAPDAEGSATVGRVAARVGPDGLGMLVEGAL